MKRILIPVIFLLCAMSCLWYLPSEDASSYTVADLSEVGFCQIEIQATEKMGKTWSLQLSKSEVRMEYGKWNSIYYDVMGQPLCDIKSWKAELKKAPENCLCKFKLDCSIPRQYRFFFKDVSSGEIRWIYYPSDSTFTTKRKLLL
ncbi:MAG: hypothetical protein MRZ79_18985 [Bacteroidia bacterium]|nr:hypothetical protein [Bacteroidia bacterium]